MSLTKYLLSGAFIILLGVSLKFGNDIYQVSKEQTRLKEEYASVNRINYGLFNLQLWKEKAFHMFREKASDFTITPQVYSDVEDQLVIYLGQMYDEYIASGLLFDQMLTEAEKSGKINAIFSKLIKSNLEEQISKLNLKSKIPGVAEDLAGMLKENEPKIKQYLAMGLEGMLFEGEDAQYLDPRSGFFSRLGYRDLQEYNTSTKANIEKMQAELDKLILREYILLLSGVVLLLLLNGFLGLKIVTTLITLISIVFLALGVTLPMIDIDARLNQFRMAILGQEISFDEQFLYYQSKSILDVTKTLIEGRGIDLKIVGVLVLMFSVVIPFIKLSLSSIFMYTDRLRNSSIARGIIFYLGKWSMADVFVVAMFMAYIGFYGIITSQLLEIKGNKTGYAVETLNYSQLSPGALFFTTYCVLSIITGILIHRWHRKFD